MSVVGRTGCEGVRCRGRGRGRRRGIVSIKFSDVSIGYERR